MALITTITHLALQSVTGHTPADCTFDVVTEPDGKKYLQLDTYGSKGRKLAGKKSQSLRLAPSAIQQLKEIVARYQL